MRLGTALALVLLWLVAAPGATAQSSADRALERTLAANMRAAGPASGAYVLDTADRGTLFKWRSDTPRILASNTKLFTAAAALDAHGPDGTLPTVVLGSGALSGDTWRGDLYLRGGGDPTFGSASFVRRNYSSGTTAEDLARAVSAAGIESVTGRVYGDESRFDSLRGGPDTGYRTSIYLGGPLSALSYNRGFANANGSAFQANPPAFAAARFDALLEARGIEVRGKPSTGTAPSGADEVARVESPPVATLVRMTLKPSDNFFAETLSKGLPGARGSTRGGAAVSRKHALALGARVSLGDGSGLYRGDRASPRSVGRLLDAVRGRPEFAAFERALPIAGKDGTLHDRLRSAPARGRCRAKTGTLSNVSALSGYCRSRGGDTLVFSFLMNNVAPAGARRLQDRMTQALAAYRG